VFPNGNEKTLQGFLQGLKPVGLRALTPGLKPRPPKEKAFAPSLFTVASAPRLLHENSRLPSLRQSKQKAAATKDWETIGNTAFDFAQSFP
jgi:hypothetical protein